MTQLKPFASTASGLVAPLEGFLRQLNPLSAYLAPYSREMASFFSNDAGSFQYTDATGHAARILLPISRSNLPGVLTAEAGADPPEAPGPVRHPRHQRLSEARRGGRVAAPHGQRTRGSRRTPRTRGSEEREDDHGIPEPDTAAVRRQGVEEEVAPRARQAGRPGLGRARLRHARRGVPHLPHQDRHLRRRRSGDHRRDHARARRPRLDRRLVDRADRPPEGRRLHDRVGDARPRVGHGPAHLPLPSPDRQQPLLAAARHDPTSPVAGQDPGHQGLDAHRARRRSLRGRGRHGALPAGRR